MAQKQIKKTTHTPLRIISRFLSFVEIVLGYAVSNTYGGIQIALTIFLIAFSILIATMFFIMLWHKPLNLYAPSDFPNPNHYKELNIMRKEVVIKHFHSF